MKNPAAALMAVIAAAPALSAQTISVSASRWLTDPPIYDFTASIQEGRWGPVRWKPGARYTSVGGSQRAGFLGAGADLRVPLGARARPFLTGGASAGFLNLDSSLGVEPWFAWTLGIGAELLRASGFGIQAEAAYRRLSSTHLSRPLDGLALGLRIGNPFGRPARGSKPASAPAAATRRSPQAGSSGLVPLSTVGAPSAIRVVDAALDAMGTPYQWGGTSANGFDCSGLIVYAYRAIGIDVPRRSGDQARAGADVPREIAALLPGDILTFSADAGGPVTHVGLYAGDGQFIHSSAAGVRLSRLGPDDLEGTWWWPRWVGARRVVGNRE